MKRILLTALFLMVIVPVAFCAEFWGSKKSNKYHYPTCGWARKINQENLVKFNSPEAAIRAGTFHARFVSLLRLPDRGEILTPYQKGI